VSSVAMARAITVEDDSSATVARPRTPVWARWSLAAILSSSAALLFVNLLSAGFSDFYATGAKSMSVSWRAFFFGAFDPNATITLDKLSGFLIPQALSARLFGFSAWSLALPQAIEGLITIAAVFWIANRWLGPAGAVISTALFAYTPLLVAMFSHPMEDSMLTMFTVLAVVAWQRAIETDRWRWLVIAGLFVGLGFQAKMMQSWLILPAFAVVYVLWSSRTWSQRILRAAAMCGVAVGVSISWMTAISLVPASARPYIDATSNNNVFSMVFGYNGVDRFIHGLFPGALAASTSTASAATTTSAGSLLIRIVSHTPIKLLFPEYASQVGWLYPVAAAGVVLGIGHFRRWWISRTGPARRGERPIAESDRGLLVAVEFSLALVITLAGVMGAISLPHSAYLASLALPLALLSASGVILLWRAFRTPSSRWRYALPAVVATETGWTAWLLTFYPSFASWIVGPLLVVGLATSAVLFVMAKDGLAFARIAVPVAVSAAVMAFAAPLIWSVSTVNPAFAGTSNDAHAGPLTVSVFNPPVSPAVDYGTGLNSNRLRPSTATLEAAAYDYASERAVGLPYALVTDSWRSASPLIMNGAPRLLPAGGYSSRAPSLTSSEVGRLVKLGELRFVLLTGAAAKSAQSAPITDLQHWTRANCSLVPLSTFDPRGYLTVSGSPDSLYDCGVPPTQPRATHSS
jgi:4-amino-4-deoxy-L-arabinose transferase-like glycosyltransferase